MKKITKLLYMLKKHEVSKGKLGRMQRVRFIQYLRVLKVK